MSGLTLVTGATGKLGRLVTERLIGERQHVRVMTRRPELAQRLFGDAVEIAAGDFADAESVEAAFRGIDKLFLLSPISERLADEQIRLANAAVAAGARRIVKVSGSDWTIDPPGQSIAGDAHSAVEWHLKTLPIAHVSLRPTAWMQVSLPNLVKQAESGQPLTSAYGDAGVSFIDARDVADAAVNQLLAAQMAGKPLVLTGAEVLNIRQIAAILTRLLRRPIGVADPRGGVAPLLGNGFEHRAIAEFLVLIGSGRAAYTASSVAQTTGRAPRTVEQFLGEQFASHAALAV